MPRTAGNYNADTHHTGGWISVPANQLAVDSANLVLTRNAVGDWSLNRTAGGAETFNIAAFLPGLRRLSEKLDLQEQFGGSVGPFPAPGKPPFSGASQLAAPTGQVPKGLRITDVAAFYTVGVVSLTSAALVLKRYKADTGVVTDAPISATALPLTAGLKSITRSVTTPAFHVTDLESILAELQIVMANTGTVAIYGLGFHCDFNWD